jgi:hypothetical protein
MNIQQWLKQKLDMFELRVRAGKIIVSGTRPGTDLYFCDGWARGYMAAQRDARRTYTGLHTKQNDDGVKQP